MIEEKSEKPLEGVQDPHAPSEGDQKELSKPHKKARKKQEDFRGKFEEKEKEAKENYDRWLRAVAELENYKKRMAKEKLDLSKYANEQLLKEILPIVDNLERAIEHSHNPKGSKALYDGVKMIAKQLLTVLEKFGIRRIEALNEPFDPNYHEAMMQLETQEHKENIVVRELEKGYLLHDRLIRPSKVAISKSPDNEETEMIDNN
jgi:molecular chaperone GrpE